MKVPLKIIEAEPASRADRALPAFNHCFAMVDGVRLHYVIGGNAAGEVVVLLAGFPQSWYAWRKVMVALAADYRVVAIDLPGQGDSDHPEDGYDTQSLAVKVHGVLAQMGIDRYYLAGHDVGAWVAYPFAASYGNEVRRLALLDAGIPGVTLPDALPTAPERSWRTWHFAFHAIPDLPEILLTGREREYLNWFLRRKAADPSTFSEADMDEYLRVFLAPGGMRAGLGYYRAAALSAIQNHAFAAKGKLPMPILALSAEYGSIVDMAAPLRAIADEVQSGTIRNCGHFLPEEQSDAVARELIRFFR